MSKKTIETRKEINHLVITFYEKIKEDKMLGPIFNKHIPENKWSEHLEKLTDFWETNLFGRAKFKGNPTLKHAIVDSNLSGGVQQDHFGRWLQIWFQTIDEFYEGEKATQAKESARRMAHGQFMMIWNRRNQ